MGRSPKQLWRDRLEWLIDNCFFVFGRLLGVVMVCTAICLISVGSYAFMDLIIPFYVVGKQGPVWLLLLHRCAVVFFVINVFFNYLSCVFTDPGAPSAGSHVRAPATRGKELVGVREDVAHAARGKIDTGLEWKNCRKCTRWRSSSSTARSSRRCSATTAG